jgi:hypothetical protein
MNWRYAIGEVLLIVVGVSIALAANSWYENRQERAAERATLQQIRQTLKIDLAEFERHQRAHLEQESDIIRLIEHMEGDDRYREELNGLFVSLRNWRGTKANRAAFEALRNRGFSLVTNPALRSTIILYYEDQSLLPTNAYLNDREFVVTRLAPYMDRRIIIRNVRTMVPIDYEVLRRDAYFRNLCMTKLRRLQERILPNYQRTNKMIRELIAAIDAELMK